MIYFCITISAFTWAMPMAAYGAGFLIARILNEGWDG